MHYYKRNIGDYHKKAGRLSMLEHGAYTLLIDSCYDRERFPTKEEALEWCWARNDAEIAAVEFVLARFFEFDGVVYKQNRIEEELSAYKENCIRNSKIAKDRESKKKTKRAPNSTKRAPVEHEPPPNQEPRTKNQEPRTNKNNTRTGVLDFSAWPEMPDAQVFADYKKLRQAKRAPLTQTVVNSTGRELSALATHGVDVNQALQICIIRGWQGLKADWVLNHLSNSGATRGSHQQHPAQTPADRIREQAIRNLERLDREEVERKNREADNSALDAHGEFIQA